jgi:uncharacterized protein DUF4386
MRMPSNKGRVAGLWYLLLILLGPLRLIYIPTKLFVAGNADATVSNIAAHQQLFRGGILTDLIAAVVLVFLTLAFYRLFADTSRNLGVLIVIFGGVMPALLYFTGAAADLGALTIIRDTGFLSAFGIPQQHALAMLLLKLHDLQNTAAETLWGVWLIPLGWAVYRSRLLPRFLGFWLVLGGIAYIATSFTGVLIPQYQGQVFRISQPFTFAEIALTLWLLVKGSRQRQT